MDLLVDQDFEVRQVVNGIKPSFKANSALFHWVVSYIWLLPVLGGRYSPARYISRGFPVNKFSIVPTARHHQPEDKKGYSITSGSSCGSFAVCDNQSHSEGGSTRRRGREDGESQIKCRSFLDWKDRSSVRSDTVLSLIKILARSEVFVGKR